MNPNRGPAAAQVAAYALRGAVVRVVRTCAVAGAALAGNSELLTAAVRERRLGVPGVREVAGGIDEIERFLAVRAAEDGQR